MPIYERNHLLFKYYDVLDVKLESKYENISSVFFLGDAIQYIMELGEACNEYKKYPF